MLAFFSRLATDDFYFIWDVRTNGIIGSTISQYMGWCGRYAATFITDVFYKFCGTDQTWYFLWPLGSFILLISGTFQLIRSASSCYGFILTGRTKFILSVMFCALLFFLSVDIGETWLWYCSISSYLLSVTAFIWGSAFLLADQKNKLALPLACFSFIYVGGSSEVFSVVYGVMIALFLAFRYKRVLNMREFINDPLNRRILIAYAALGIAFLIFLIAPGNYLRDQHFPEHQVGKALFITCKSIVKFGILYLPFRLIYILAFALPFVIAGNEIRKSHTGLTFSFRKFFIRTSILFLSFTLFFFLLVAYVMVETGPPRLWFMLAFLFSLYCAAICFYAGYSGFINEGKLAVLKTSGIIIAAMILGYNLFNQFFICRDYTKAQDARIERILELNKTIKDTTIVLEPLPSSGMLYSAEIQADTNHFTNRELQMGFDLKFHVVINR
jgi:hypothetical protein